AHRTPPCNEGAPTTRTFTSVERARIDAAGVLQLRVYGEASTMGVVAEDLGRLPGARHVSLSDGRPAANGLVTADIQPEAADAALTRLARLGIPAENV